MCSTVRPLGSNAHVTSSVYVALGRSLGLCALHVRPLNFLDEKHRAWRWLMAFPEGPGPERGIFLSSDS